MVISKHPCQAFDIFLCHTVMIAGDVQASAGSSVNPLLHICAGRAAGTDCLRTLRLLPRSPSLEV